MTYLGEFRVPATRENVMIIMHVIQGIAQRLNLSEKTQFDVELAIEEASVNIVDHAYPDEIKGDIFLEVEEVGDVLRLTLKDWGEPLDERNVHPFDLDAPIETRIKGGMGLHFINSLMDGVERRISSEPDSSNSLTLIKRIERLKPGSHAPSAIRELNAILSVSRIMTADISLDDLLERIINELVATIEAERGTLYLMDKENNEIFSRVLSQDTGDIQEIRVKIGQGIAGQVAETGEIINIKDAYEYPNFSRSFDQISGFRTHSVLVTPLRNHYQEIIGVVQLLNKVDGEFTSRDERLLTAMASQAAISIENTRLYAQEMQQQLINQDLATARSIQMSFLPQRTPQHPAWEIGTFWLPMRDVGGDFYDFYLLPDGRWAIVIADVSGKGVPAAMFMAFGVTVLRFAMGLSFAPSEVMDHANQVIISDQKSKMFATAFVTYLDLDTGRVEYASAGHNPPLLYRAKDGHCEYLEAPGVAMGLFTSAAFEQDTTTLEAGDILVMYTDGITEIIDAEEEEFGEEQLEELIVQNAALSAQALTDLIIETIGKFALDQGNFDDETLIIIKKII